MVDCLRLLTHPNDSVPARAPLAVFSALSRRVDLQNKSLVVLGDVSTDGIACLSTLTSSAFILPATASRRQCDHLRARAAAYGHRFGAICEASIASPLNTSATLGAHIPDADVYLWSQFA